MFQDGDHMDAASVSLSFDMLARPVTVQLVAATKGGTHINGNLYTVDPVSGDVVIVQYESGEERCVKWIPRVSIVNLELLEEPTAECRPWSIELAERMETWFGKHKHTTEDETAEGEKRKLRLVTWLRKNHVDVTTVSDGSLLIFGAVRVESPFTPEHCYCDNSIVLNRVRAMVGKVPNE